MPWQEVTAMSLRSEFVHLAQQKGVPLTELCKRFCISRKTAYKWLQRYSEEGSAGLANRSQRPRSSPTRTAESIEATVLELRDEHPAWGGRKLSAVLARRGIDPVPAPSTVTHILRRHGRLPGPAARAQPTYHRFEHAAPNDLWQIDFKGDVKTHRHVVYPLTLLDDHSRYNLLLSACTRPNEPTVKALLIQTFERYGLPLTICSDNGSPWGSPRHPRALSRLGVWIVRLGIRLTHCRPGHPQTNGKDERFHRSLKVEVLTGKTYRDANALQCALDEWRPIYNELRPHDALQLAVPADRYQPSPRAYPDTLPDIEYGDDDLIRRVQINGRVSFKGNWLMLPKALRGHPVAFRPVEQQDGAYQVYFCHQRIGKFDLKQPCRRLPG